jgi:micrococcal nuclease
MSGGHGGERKLIGKISKTIFLIVLLAILYQLQADKIIDIGIPTKYPNTVGTFYTVTRVVDGDTLHVNIEGNDETVRLLGINTPETVDPRRPVQCFGKEASTRMKELAKGQIVRLEYDDSQSLRDAYNRLLAYVYLEDGEMLNRKMIAEGYAYEYTYMHPYKYQKEFREVQDLAKQSLRGLWSPDTCNGEK